MGIEVWSPVKPTGFIITCPQCGFEIGVPHSVREDGTLYNLNSNSHSVDCPRCSGMGFGHYYGRLSNYPLMYIPKKAAKNV